MPAVVRGQPTRKAGTPKARKAPGAQPRRAVATYGGGGRFGGLSPQLATGVAVAVFAAATVALLATGGRGQAIVQTIARGIDNSMGRAGFAVRKIDVVGGSAFSEPDILRAAHVAAGQPILGLDIDQMHDRVEKVGWVKSVRIVRMLPDHLQIVVTERPRLAVWQNRHALNVVDADGRVIAEADPNRFQDLPLVVGEGANTSASALLPLIQARPKLMSRVWALVRVDGRRWDVLLKDNSRIQLPAEGEEAALMRLDQLDRDQHVLSLGFTRIDLKSPDLRVRPSTATQPATTPVAG